MAPTRQPLAPERFEVGAGRQRDRLEDRDHRRSGEALRDVAHGHEVSRSNVGMIQRRKTWGWLI